MVDESQPDEDDDGGVDGGSAAEVERRDGTVGATEHGERLDKVVVALAPEFSRSHLQSARSRAAGCGSTASRATSASQRVRVGQRIEVALLPTAESRAYRAEPLPLAVVHEDDDILVIDKAAGMVVHPAAGNWSGTLLNALLARDPASAALPRAGIVHRLDKDTSGLMVVGRTLAAVTALVRAIAAREVHRRYLAIAHGKAPAAPIHDRGADRPRSAGCARGWRSSRRARPARTDVELAAAARGLRRAALHAAHRPHAPDPRPSGVARAAAGRRSPVRRRTGARHGAPGAACRRARASRIRRPAARSSFRAAPPHDFAHAWREVAGPRSGLDRTAAPATGYNRPIPFRCERSGRHEPARRSARPSRRDRTRGCHSTAAGRACRNPPHSST